MGLNLSPDETLHCRWAPADDPLYRAYHDEEWGRSIMDGPSIFAQLVLQTAQSGLSWKTINDKKVIVPQ